MTASPTPCPHCGTMLADDGPVGVELDGTLHYSWRCRDVLRAQRDEALMALLAICQNEIDAALAPQKEENK